MNPFPIDYLLKTEGSKLLTERKMNWGFYFWLCRLVAYCPAQMEGYFGPLIKRFISQFISIGIPQNNRVPTFITHTLLSIQYSLHPILRGHFYILVQPKMFVAFKHKAILIGPDYLTLLKERAKFCGLLPYVLHIYTYREGYLSNKLVKLFPILFFLQN